MRNREAFESWAKSQGYNATRKTHPFTGVVTYHAEGMDALAKCWTACEDHFDRIQRMEKVAQDLGDP